MIIEKIDKLEQLHKMMIEEVQDFAIILLDIDGTILTWNKGVEKIKGYKAHDEDGNVVGFTKLTRELRDNEID